MLRGIVLLVAASTPGGCCTGAALDWSHPEVTIRGGVRSSKAGRVEALRIDVKNVENVRDGHYRIDLPATWPQEAEAELPIAFERSRPFFLVRWFQSYRSSHFARRYAIPDRTAPFHLQAEVERDEHDVVRVAIEGDRLGNGVWTRLGSATVGRGTQGHRSRGAAIAVGATTDVAILVLALTAVFVVAGPDLGGL